MAEQTGAVIIRDDTGTEHEFPAGFDPKRAAEIVRQQTAPSEAVGARPRGWQPAGTFETSDGPAAASPLLDLLGPLAHPQTLTDFARLLTLPVDAVKKAAASALAMTAATRAASVARELPATAARGAVNVVAGAGDVVSPDVIGAVSPRAGKVVEIAQRVREAQRASAAAAEAAPATAAPTEFQAAQAARQASNALPDQKALNEAALAARRAAYQASQSTAAPAAAAEPIVAASGKMQLTASEMKEFQRLVARGVKLPDALEQVRAMRDLASRLGGATAEEMAKDMAHRRYKS